MGRFEIIKNLKKYFVIQELVGPRTYRKLKDRAWRLFSTEALLMLLITREGIDKPFTMNNWHKGGKYSQRGYRSNLQNIVRQLTLTWTLYLSAHPLGEGFDYTVKGMHPEHVRRWIIEHEHLYPMKIRLEHLKNGKPITWVHQDSIQEEHNPEVYLFDV